MRFTKMQGLGNDYVYIAAKALPENAADLAVRLSDRHFGIGGDGVIWILPSEAADCAMRIFNADGSEGAMCGNGVRCVAKYWYERQRPGRQTVTVETRAGIKTARLGPDGVAVQMGRAVCRPPLAPLPDRPDLCCTPVDVGNPHAVFFTDDLSDGALAAIGQAMQTAVPGGVNTELVQPLGPARLRMRVWERGSGVTLACGTGACAAAAAAVAAGLAPADTPVEVVLDGGSLRICVGADGAVTMEGPAETVFEGEIDPC